MKRCAHDHPALSERDRAAIREMEERVREMAAKRCPAHTTAGVQCALDAGHEGLHHTGWGGWFGSDGAERSVR